MIFPRGIVHGFCQKLAIFHVFILVEIGKKYVFYDILERKNAFVDKKKHEVKKVENMAFFQRR